MSSRVKGNSESAWQQRRGDDLPVAMALYHTKNFGVAYTIEIFGNVYAIENFNATTVTHDQIGFQRQLQGLTSRKLLPTQGPCRPTRQLCSSCIYIALHPLERRPALLYRLHSLSSFPIQCCLPYLTLLPALHSPFTRGAVSLRTCISCPCHP
jgi:hypothetical protein